MHLAIAGNIGSGKTTLTTLLSKHYNLTAYYEDVEENPYLDDFYEDMSRWSFALQVYFLNSRFKQVADIQRFKQNVVQDRTIYEDAYIFAPNLNQMGLMSDRDYNNYFSLFLLMSSFVKPPDLLIYLKASVSTLVNQIEKRGREYEKTIRIDYLSKLNDRYDRWISNYKESPLLIIDVDNIKFSENDEHLSDVISKVDAYTNGLF